MVINNLLIHGIDYSIHAREYYAEKIVARKMSIH